MISYLARTALGLVGISASYAAPFAYISVSDPSDRSVKVMDLQTMTIVRNITGVGNEPSRMVISPDYNRIYVASYIPASQGVLARGMIYAIDTVSRRVVGEVAVGLIQNRALGMSPDGSRLYTWKVTNDGVSSTRNLAVINSADLSEIAIVALPASCLQTTGDIAVHPDGRVFFSGCNEGIYIMEPSTLALTFFVQPPATNTVLMGFSPDGAELYVPVPPSSVRAFNVSTGAGNNFFFNLPSGSPAISGVAHRMVASKRVNTGLATEPVFFTFFDAASGGLAIAHARRDELAPSIGSPTRRFVGTTSIGPADVMGVDTDSQFALTGRLSEVRKQTLTTASSAVIEPASAITALPGVWRKTDLVFTDEFSRNGFE
jgi:DNA-binding beta-propeller fold protein YncE